MKNILSKLFKFLGDSAREDNGNVSNVRVIVLISFLFLIPAIAFTLVYTTLKYDSMVVAVLAAILTFLSSLLGIKALQKGKEEKVETANVKSEKSNEEVKP